MASNIYKDFLHKGIIAGLLIGIPIGILIGFIASLPSSRPPYDECDVLQAMADKHGGTDAEMTIYNLRDGKPWRQWIVGNSNTWPPTEIKKPEKE